MKCKTKIFIALLVFFNFYFLSFFVWFKPEHPGIRFIDNYAYIPAQGPYATTFLTPRVSEGIDKPAGNITRTISNIYAPLVWYWQKRGVCYYYPDEYSIAHEKWTNHKTSENNSE